MPKFIVNHYGKFIEIETSDKSVVIYYTDKQLRDLYKQLNMIYGEVQLPKKFWGYLRNDEIELW